MKKINYFLALGTVFSLSLCIQADPGKKNKNLMRMDKDKNGVLSFTEFSSRSEKMFSFLDQNSDGNITRQEMNIKESLKREKMLSKMADKLDRNDDQKIDKNEFIIGSKRLAEPRQRPKRRGLPKGLAPNNKKEVSEAIFKALDKNKDGYLNSEELSKRREVGPKVAKDHIFQKLDLSGNKKVSKEEFMSPSKKRFDEMDKNSDEVLDRRELMDFFKKKMKGKRYHKDNMWKGRPPVMHRDGIRH